MINKTFERHRRFIEKLLLGLVNVGNLAIACLVVGGFALWHGNQKFLNPAPASKNLWDYVAGVTLFPLPVIRYVLVVGSISAICYSFLTPQSKDKWFFSATGMAMALISVLFLGLWS